MNKRKGQACLEPAREIDPEEGVNWLAYFREKDSTFGPSLRASRGDPVRRLTARVPPCSRSVQGSRPRIAPRFPRPSPAEGSRRFRQCRSGPAGAAQASRVPAGGRGELGLDPAEPGLRPAGVPPPERSAGGGGHPGAPRFARRGCRRLHRTDAWNCSAGEAPLPGPSRTALREGPRGLLPQNQQPVESFR